MEKANQKNELWFQSNGTELFGATSGTGAPVVFLHGLLADHLAALQIVEPLVGRYEVITPDVRGSGRSRFGGCLSWSQLADDVVAMMDCLGIKRAVVGGVSSGSAVAIRCALDHPDRVGALVVALPPYAGADRGLTGAQKAAFEMMDALGSRAPAEGTQVLRPMFEALPAETRKSALAMLERLDPASVSATTRFIASGLHPFGQESELTAIAAPTLLIPGADPLHPPEVAKSYSHHLPDCLVKDCEGGQMAPAIFELCARVACDIG